ncbi:hypothetical protein ND860_18165 [Leptospira levettii]|uniref:hypothetical protein n=1 Tax=Leptospira levettii TaxID=2023178 RepID=UPI00223DD904|nr:hypothetical protein [Leptospira levettii]MCW7498467.1 hypothetical protein [Leptospira levettii]
MNQTLYLFILLFLSILHCKSISSIKQKPLQIEACPNFGFLELTKEQKDQAYSFLYYGDWREREELGNSSSNRKDREMYDNFIQSKKSEITESHKLELVVIALKSTKDEVILVPLDLAIDAKKSVNNQDSMNAWKHFYFRLCPDENVVKNFDQTEYAQKVLKIKNELISNFGKKSIRELTNYIIKIDKQLDNMRNGSEEMALKKRVAWQWFLERLDNTTKNYIKIKYPKLADHSDKSVSFFDKNDYPNNLFTFHTMFRVLFRENPSSPGGIAESTFRLELNPKSKSFNLIHTILRNDNTEYPIANVFFLEDGDQILITKLLEQTNTEPAKNWEYITVQFFNEIVGSMGSYDFDLRYVNASRFDQYEPKSK